MTTLAKVQSYCDTEKWPLYRDREGEEVRAIEMVAPFYDEDERLVVGYLVVEDGRAVGYYREQFEQAFTDVGE